MNLIAREAFKNALLYQKTDKISRLQQKIEAELELAALILPFNFR